MNFLNFPLLCVYMNPTNNQKTDDQPSENLHSSWNVYTTERIKNDTNFKDQLVKICTFNTINEFAYVYSRLKRPSQLNTNTSVYFVRANLNQLPLWENHINGGTYQFKRTIEKSTKIQLIDRNWENLVFSVLGEQLQEPIISTIQITTKQDYSQISVWHFNRITKREYSRIQLKLGDIFECKVRDFEYVTNIDQISQKRALKQKDQQNKQEVQIQIEEPVDKVDKPQFQVIVKQNNNYKGKHKANSNNEFKKEK